MLHHPCVLGCPQRQARGAKAQVVVALLTSGQPKRGQKCYVTPASSGVRNAKRGEQNKKWLSHPCLLGGQKEGGNALPPLPSRGSPTPSAGINITNDCLNPDFLDAEKRAEMLRIPCILGGTPTPSAGSKIRSGYLTPAFSGGKKRAEMLCHTCLLREPPWQGRGAKSEMVATLLTSWQPKRGRKCFVTLASSGVPNAKRGEEKQKGLSHS